MNSSICTSRLSRRDFLATTGAVLAAATLPSQVALAQTSAKYHRVNVSGSAGSKMIESYKKAIRAMLALPPSDPRNWYRIALTHTLDCPHGNWWFFVWHRGYIGWFEKICRELSGDPNFALPYWDWTKEPRIPEVMFEDVLTPNDSAFIGTFDEFSKKFGPVVDDYWQNLSEDQVSQLLNRGLRFPQDLWFDVIKDPRGRMFFNQPNARGLTKEKPGLDVDADVLMAASLPTLLNALSPRDFITFASSKTFFHSGLTGFGVLEGSPHNLIHNCVGGVYSDPPEGFMQSNLSPIDPLFFLHHANIDRLWDVWTRKQLGFNSPNYPILPQGYQQPTERGTDWAAWSRERFLFFVDAVGHPVGNNKAGDYAAIGEFDYDYEPGSGEEVVRPTVVTSSAAPQATEIERQSADITDALVRVGKPASATVELPKTVTEATAAASAPILFAKVTVALAPDVHTAKFRVIAKAASEAPGVRPFEAGVFAMFGHHHVPGPVTFTVPLSQPVSAMRESNVLEAKTPLRLSVLVDEHAMPSGPMAEMAAGEPTAAAEVLSIVVEAH